MRRWAARAACPANTHATVRITHVTGWFHLLSSGTSLSAHNRNVHWGIPCIALRVDHKIVSLALFGMFEATLR